jgi:hypothetical protein
MSPELQGIVTSHCYGRYLENIPFLRYDTKHMRGIRKLRAEEEKQMFITQVRCRCCYTIPRRRTCALLYASWIKSVLIAARHPNLLENRCEMRAHTAGSASLVLPCVWLHSFCW